MDFKIPSKTCVYMLVYVWIIWLVQMISLDLQWAVTMMPNIFIFLEADVLGGRLDSKKWVQAYFTWPKFSVVWKSRYLMNQSYVATNTVR